MRAISGIVRKIMGDHGAQTVLACLLALKRAGGPRAAKKTQALIARRCGPSLTLSAVRALMRRCHFSDEARPRARRDRQPSVTVVVPVHGTEAHLSECLISLVSQTLDDLQIVVVDDASPDASNDIILDFMLRDERITFVRNEENQGLLLARQAGARFAKGRYLAHLDSDDFVAPGTYALTLARAQETGAEIVQFGMRRLKHGKLLAHEAARPVHEDLSGQRILQAFLRSGINFSVCNKLYDRRLWERASAEFPRRSWMVEDLAQNAVLLRLAKRYVSLPDALHTYRITVGSDSRTSDLESLRFRALSAVRHLARLKKALQENGQLTRLWPDVGQLERRVYDDYVRPLVGAFANLPMGARSKRKKIRTAIRQMARLNGWLALKPWLRSHPWLWELPREAAGGRRPAVSLIIPVFNQPEFLARALTSARAQTLKDVEIVVGDDGSTDETPDIIAEWQGRSKRVQPVRHEKNQGLLLARQSGVRAARGRYIAHLDVDDELVPETLLALVNRARESEANIVQCGYVELRPGGERKVLCRDVGGIEGPDILDRFLKLDGVSNGMWNKLYRRDLYRRALPLMPRENQLAEDFCQNTILMALADKLEHIVEPLYRYTIRDGSGDRDASPARVCARAVSACFNMQQARYVAAVARHPRRVANGLEAREDGYFARMMAGIERLASTDGLLASDALAECCALAEWPLASTPLPKANLATPSDLSAVDGVCERIEGGRARGWLVDRANLAQVLDIDIYWDGVLIETLPAGNHRGDLERIGWGGGRHGFLFDLPADAKDGSVHALSICVAGTNLSLRKCPATIRNGKAELGPNRMGDVPPGLVALLRKPWRRR